MRTQLGEKHPDGSFSPCPPPAPLNQALVQEYLKGNQILEKEALSSPTTTPPIMEASRAGIDWTQETGIGKDLHAPFSPSRGTPGFLGPGVQL